MAGHKIKRPKLPLCAGTRADGSACNSYRELGFDYCRWHLAQDGLIEQAPAEFAPDEDDEMDAEVDEPMEHRSVDPSVFRQELATDLSADYALVHRALREAMDAKTEKWGKCPRCKIRVAVNVADHRSRLDAVKTWTELGFGKAAAEIRQTTPTLADLGVKSLREMSDDELEAVMVASYLEDPELLEADKREIEAVHRALSEGQTVKAAALAGLAAKKEPPADEGL